VILVSAGGLVGQEFRLPSHPDRGWPPGPAAVNGIAASSIGGGQRLIRFNGRALDGSGQPVTEVAGVTFAIYGEQSGGAALWQETQNVTTDATGRFSALLGASSAAGVPVELFSSGEARWLGVLTHAPGAAEQPRVLLVSVPYALSAADSEMLGGKPASAYMTVNPGGCVEAAPAPLTQAELTQAEPIPAIAAPGAVAGRMPVFTDTSGDMGNSLLFQSGAYVGIGTTTPSFNFHVISQTDPAAITVEGYGLVGINFMGRRAEGTLAKPTALLAGDNIMAMQGRGYGTTGFSGGSRAYMKFFAAENWTDSNQGTYISLATTAKGSSTSAERLRITDAGNVGIGTATPGSPLTVAGAIQSTSGGFIFPDGSVMNSAASLAGSQPGGNLILAAGTGSGGAGNVEMQTAGTGAGTVIDRLLIAGQAKAMSGAVPTANLFSMHIAAGDAAGGRVKFTIVASDGSHYAMETGEIAYLASPQQFICGVVISEYSTTPPSYTNGVLAIPAIGQIGALNAQCNPAYFGGDPGVQIFDTAPTSFTPTTHKVYYTIENQSQASITLQP
jgi:hypothetical protein